MIRPARHLPAALLVLLTLTAAGLGACGSSTDATDTTATSTAGTTTTAAAAAKGRYTVKQVAKLIGLKQNADGTTWTSATGCRVTVVMTTHAEVLTYRTSQSEPVVTNPADDIGVKFDPVAGCREALTANLTKAR